MKKRSLGRTLQTLRYSIQTLPPKIREQKWQARVGQRFYTMVSTENFPSRFSSQTPLPAGLRLHTKTGVLQGTPKSLGEFPLTISASNEAGSDTSTILLTILPAIPK